MLNLNSVMVGSMQQKALAAFYEKVFQKAPEMAEGNWSGWMVGSSFFSVGEHSEMAGMAKDPGRVMFNFETTEVKEEFERIKEIGATIKKREILSNKRAIRDGWYVDCNFSRS